MKNILIIAAHPDDEILGCGGLISKTIQKRSRVRVIFLAEGVTSRYAKEEINSKKVIKKSQERNNNALDALMKLGLNKKQIFFSNNPCCRLDNLNQLELVKIIEKHLNDFKPNEIYTHWHSDANIDHRITYEATITATRPVYKFNIELIACYEVLSSTEWNFKKSFNPNLFINIDDHIENKITAIKLYKNEIKSYPHSRSLKSIRSLASFRGVQSGFKNAEAFEIIRLSK
tara:strand:- start:161 stop:850 length:690 start_codon:yes stop_codon:yes gene_type:complete